MSPGERIHVVAAVIRDDQGRVLLAQRATGSHLAGLWEFPGGKREAGETPWQALVRELDEELGITVTTARPLIAVPHSYPGKSILLDVWQVDAYTGMPWSREGQPLQWVELAALDDRIPMPAADRPVLAALRLPRHYLITPDWPPERAAALRDGLLRSLHDGIRLIRLRLPQWSQAAQRELAAEVLPAIHAHAAILLDSGDPAAAIDAGFDGVHLSAAAAASLDRRPIPRNRWLAVSCHDADELAHAARIEADFAILSPVAATTTHPSSAVLGWDRFRDLIAEVAMPVYALGGMSRADVTIARDAGGQGIAAITALWPDS